MLIEYNLRLVAHIAKKYQMMEADMEELVSIGAVGLIKAVDTFDQEKPVSWQPMQPVVWKMRSLCISGSERKYPENPPIMEPIGTDKEGNEIRLLDIMESQDPEALDVIELKDDTRKDLYLIGSCAHSPGKTGADHALWSLPRKGIYPAGDCRRIGNLQILYQQN